MLTMLLPVARSRDRTMFSFSIRSWRQGHQPTGRADLRNEVATLQATLNLEPLSPGAYQLAIRRSGQEWQMFPAQVK
jgi:hypothetical protein